MKNSDPKDDAPSEAPFRSELPERGRRLPDGFAEVDLGQLALTVLSSWRWILGGAGVGLILGLFYTHIATEIYSARMTVAPKSGDQNSALSGLNSVGRLVGISADFGGDEEFNKYLALLKSRRLAAQLAKTDGIMQTLFAGEWDRTRQRWRPPSVIKQAVKGALGFPAWRAPDESRLAARLQEMLVIRSSLEHSLVTIELEHSNAGFGVKLLEAIHLEADKILRTEARITSDRKVAYLESQLSHVRATEHRQGLIELLSATQQKLMLIEADQNFVAEPIDPPSGSTLPVWPMPKTILAGGAFFGALVGGLLAWLFRHPVANVFVAKFSKFRTLFAPRPMRQPVDAGQG